jgi:hypothetical protein
MGKRRFLNTKAQTVDRVTDDMLAGNEGLLYHVTMKHQVDLSPASLCSGVGRKL